MERKTYLQLVNMKEPYDTAHFAVDFENVEDLIKKIDGLIEESGFKKVDATIDDQDGVLVPEEIEQLEDEDISVI
jgi:hypothetical protein